MGLGMTIVVPAAAAPRAVELLKGNSARVVGKLVPRGDGPSSRLAPGSHA